MTGRRPAAGRTRTPADQVAGQGSLFDVEAPAGSAPPAGGIAPEPLPADPKTRGQIRLKRQGEALAAGWHPLSLTSAPGLRLHADAAPAGDRAAPGLRCGTCRMRVLQSGHARAFPKCLYPDPDVRPRGGWPRDTNGDGTDVRAWWPACPGYQPVPPPAAPEIPPAPPGNPAPWD